MNKSTYNSRMRAFLDEYANWNALRKIFLTFDVDWAPEFMIENVLEILDAYDVSATFFATHDSQILKTVTSDDRYEIAHHIFLDPFSDQGTNIQEASVYLRKHYPDAVGNRFHLLAYSYRDLQALSPLGYRYDVSTLRLNCPYLLPTYHHDLDMVLLTYAWEDGICENSGFKMEIPFNGPGVKIFNFHPLNVYINGPDAAGRHELLQKAPSLLDCSEQLARGFRNKDSTPGAQYALKQLLDGVMTSGIETDRMGDLVNAFRNAYLNPQPEIAAEYGYN